MEAHPYTENKVLMAQARDSLRGNWGLPIGTTVVYWFIAMVSGLVPFIGPIISLLIAGPMMLGFCIFFLSFSRNQNPRLSQIFEGFSKFGVAFYVYLLSVIFVFLWTLLLIIPGIIAALSYAMTFYIMSDNESIGPLNTKPPGKHALDVIRASKEMMRGNKWKLFCLGLRFIGWSLLCVLTLGIGYLWLTPYMCTSFAKFYDDIASQCNVAEPKSEFTVPSEKKQTFDQPEYISEEGAKGRSEHLPISTRARSWRIFGIVAVGILIVFALGYLIRNNSSRSSSLGPSTPIPPRRALSFFIEKEEWNALPAGSPIYSEGKEYTIKSDLAGVMVLLAVVNHDRKKQSFRFPVVLVGEDGSSFGFLKLGDVTSGGSKISSDKGLFVKAGQNILVELTSTMKDYQELYDAQPLYLNVSRHDQKFGLKPVPSWKSLCEKREETILQNRKK